MIKEIPKVIHYCWFGGAPLPDLAIKCIESWKKYCPDYEIKEWNENNYDVNKCDYIREAYQAKKWAFVSDYARFDILYQYGGIYFDTDVELIKPIDDILKVGSFMGQEKRTDKVLAVNPGLGLAAYKRSDFLKEILGKYNEIHFLKPDKSYNITTVVNYTTDLLQKYGLRNTNDIQLIAGIYIYPPEYFCPVDYETGQIDITDNTRSIHHFSQSWFDEKDKQWHKRGQRLKQIFGIKMGNKIMRFLTIPYRVNKKIKQKGLKATVNMVFELVKRNIVSLVFKNMILI